FMNPESVSSTTTSSTIPKTLEFRITSEQCDILQYQLTAVNFALNQLAFIVFLFVVYSIINSIYPIET
ncbi:unnamed protein product, partial [Rotaria socialis]